MLPIEDQAPSLGSFFRRSVAAWDRFFFRPSDPTTLCLMRILAALLIVYTHLAYTRDLYEFFGKDGWINLELAQDLRHGYPYVRPADDWDNTQAQSNITLPLDPSVRAVFVDWLRNLPSDKQRRREVLSYLHDDLGPNSETTFNALAFAQNLKIVPKSEEAKGVDWDGYKRTTDEARSKQLATLVRPKLEGPGSELIPRHLRDIVTVEDRQAVRRNLEAFLDTLPPEPGKVSRLFSGLVVQATSYLPQRKHTDPTTDLQRTLRYIQEDLPNDPNERTASLAYLQRFGVDLKKTYSHGLYTWSIFFHVTNPTAMMFIHICSLIVMVMFALGLFTRVTSVLTWLAALNYIHRTNQVLFGMDVMMNICMLYLMIGPSGATLSLDRWWAKKRAQRQIEAVKARGGDTSELEAFLAGPQPSIAANFATRLFQIHFCFVYMASGLSKLKGAAWWNHTAIWSTMANPEFSPTVFAPYRWFLVWLADHRWLWEVLMSFGGYFTLILEIGLPFLIWRPRLRPYVVAAGVLFHTGIATVMGLTVFSLFMMVLLMSFIPPEAVRRWLDYGGRLLPSRTREPIVATPAMQRQVVASSSS